MGILYFLLFYYAKNQMNKINLKEMLMCKLIKAIKFNDEYFENEQVVVVTKENGEVIVGSVLLLDYNGGSVTSERTLVIDTSEKFHNKRTFISFDKIKNIQKVNE